VTAGLPDAGASAPALAVSNLSKSFGGTRALEAVSLTVQRGEVHGLLGQNGSGKSTLIKVLAGFHTPDPGAGLALFGRHVPLPLAPGGFQRLGLAFVHQHLGLVPSLSVLENLRIGEFASHTRVFIDWRAERSRAQALFDRYGLAIDPLAQVESLSPVERALLAILRAFEDLREARALAGGALLILDEPTSFLPKPDVDRLFGLVRDLVAEGSSVILVSHDIDEVMAITDRVTVLRNGQLSGTVTTRETTRDALVALIVGGALDSYRMAPRSQGDRRRFVQVSNLSGGGVSGLSFGISRGEILGVTGLVGAGYAAIPYLLIGDTKSTTGELAIGERHLPLAKLTPTRARAHGIALLPGDRLGQGGVGSLPVVDNVTLPNLWHFLRGWGLDRSEMTRVAAALGLRYAVYPNNPALPLEALSGGNQQKVLLAKGLATSPALLLLDEPTQGVDIGARQQLFALLDEARSAGTAILCASTDYEQLAQICDRVLVFRGGIVVAELSEASLTKHAIATACYESDAPILLQEVA
jgi:ribose transport system ATP-binding protein